MSFSTLPNFDKVTKKVATFNYFSNYIRNPAKILASCQNFGNYAKIVLVSFFFHQSEQALWNYIYVTPPTYNWYYIQFIHYITKKSTKLVMNNTYHFISLYVDIIWTWMHQLILFLLVLDSKT